MARLPRYFIPGCPQHIIPRGNNRQAIFAVDADMQFWRDCLVEAAGRRYVQYFNATYRRSGTLFEGRYRATVVDSERYLLACMRHIEDKPVRAAMVAQPADYPWSRHGANAAGARGQDADWLMPHEAYTRLGAEATARQQAYRALWKGPLDEAALALIRSNTHTGWALGDARFAQEVEALSQRRAPSLGRGRPRKVSEAEEGNNRV